MHTVKPCPQQPVATYQPATGSTITACCEHLAELATISGEEARAIFNGIEVVAQPNSLPGDLEAYFWSETNRRRAEYEASDEYKAAVAEAERKHAERVAAVDDALAVAPARMTFADGGEAKWQASLDANKDEYGACVLRYGERWARIMEGRLAAGASIADCAEQSSRMADTEGITGFMYGCAMSILAEVWAHGEQLRRWHNLKTQLGTEGEKANESGGVLNPALLSIGAAS